MRRDDHERRRGRQDRGRRRGIALQDPSTADVGVPVRMLHPVGMRWWRRHSVLEVQHVWDAAHARTVAGVVVVVQVARVLVVVVVMEVSGKEGGRQGVRGRGGGGGRGSDAEAAAAAGACLRVLPHVRTVMLLVDRRSP